VARARRRWMREQGMLDPARLVFIDETSTNSERQMLALGRALMSRLRLLMHDEPSLGLAPLIVREIFRIIATLRAAGVSILLIEQNARAALQAADLGYVLDISEAARGAIGIAPKQRRIAAGDRSESYEPSSSL
jgi:branched-chain amino acid transport system ATP-binding protein